MQPFSRQANAEFVAFKQFSEAALRDTPDLLRLDCLNPIKAIPHGFDFSLVPEIDIRSAWRNFLKVRFSNCVFTQGVRESLYNIFVLLREEDIAVDLPCDVYPVYQKMAKQLGLPYREYPTLPYYGTDSFQTDTAIITAPCVPSGRDLCADDVSSLQEWLNKSPRRLLIIDRVYDYNNSAVIQPLIDSGQAVICYSLSKTFLSPLTMGMTIVPPHLEVKLSKPLPPDVDKAKVLLTRYKEFPRQQQSMFRYRWNRLKETLDFSPPETGYLAVVPKDHRELLNEGVLAIPGDVYGTSNIWSVLTCLHETNAYADSQAEKRYYVTVLSNFAKAFDKYSRTYSKDNIRQSAFPNQFFVLDAELEAGFAKARRLLEKTVSGDKPIVLRTAVRNCELQSNLRTGIGSFLERNWIEVDAIYDETLQEMLVEDAYAASLALNQLPPWSSVRPRSLSVLPIASQCQAHCDFCFSHSSISDDQDQGTMFFSILNGACAQSVNEGAERLVITGGGEPTLLSHRRLLEIIRIGKRHFEKIVMITNGCVLGNTSESDRLNTLKDYEEAGLTVLSISRHSPDANAEIMKLDTKSELVADTWRNSSSSIQLRWVCVLQRQGVHDEATLATYLDWVVDTGVTQVCFKELYVATTRESVYHDSSYNEWCRKNQVSLRVVLSFLIWNQARRISELPWGSPIYLLKWKGKDIQVAAYTEPSVFWERSKGICRSWNLMADGTCYANLETKDSEVMLHPHKSDEHIVTLHP